MDTRYLQQAIALAGHNVDVHNGGPFGAVVVKDGKVIAEGWNQVTASCDPTAHAEVVAIRKACQVLGDFSLVGCQLYSSCEPCPMCLAASYWARLDAVYFAASREDAAAIGFDDADIYQQIAQPFSLRRLPMAQALRADAQAVMQRWSQSAIKIHY